MAGLSGLSSKTQGTLQDALASQAAPPNPSTEKDRTDPAESKLLDLQRVRRSLAIAKEHFDDTDPAVLLISAMNGCVSRMLSGVQLSDAADALLEGVFPLASQQLKMRLQSMFAPQVSPPTGLGGGAAAKPPGAAATQSSLLAPGAQASAPPGPGVPAGGGAEPPAA